MYTFQTRVRYSECNAKEQAGLSNVLDYLQDVCTFQAEDLDVGVSYLEEHQVAWILSSWQVDIKRYPVLGEEIQIMTWPYDYHGFYGFRNFQIEDSAGQAIVQANSVWVFMDMHKGRPAKISPRMEAAYPKEEKLTMEYLDRKVPDFEGKLSGEAFRVPHYFIDTNDHVNNAKYVLLAEGLLPEGFKVARIRAEYKKSAVYGDILYPYVIQEPDKTAVKLDDGAGSTYAIMEFYS